METIGNFVDATLNLATAEKEFTNELVEILGINPLNIKRIYVKNVTIDTKLTQIVVIELIRTNLLKSEDIAKIDGLVIRTPNTLEIVVSEIVL